MAHGTHKESGETPLMEAKTHTRGFLKSAEHKAGKLKKRDGKLKPHHSKAHKGGH